MLVPGGRLAQARVFLPVLQHPKISCGCIQAIHFVREPASSVSGVVSMTEHGTLVGLGAETLLLRLELSCYCLRNTSNAQDCCCVGIKEMMSLPKQPVRQEEEECRRTLSGMF